MSLTVDSAIVEKLKFAPDSDRRDWKAVVAKDEESKGFTARVKRLVIG